MKSLLELERIGKSYRRGARVALEGVSMDIDAGEMVIVWGERHSGRTTLLRIAAGVEPPDTGVVRFEGRELSERRGEMLGSRIGFCRGEFHAYRGPTVLDQLVTSQFASRVAPSEALARAWRALERVGGEQCAALATNDLKIEETVRVSIARALCSAPRLVVVDEPTIGLDSLKRDEILELLRSLADEGIAVLASAGDGTGLLGADRVLSLGKGKLHGAATPSFASVTDLDRRRQTRS
jgi:putative ABC transport system ATP-binding protein